MKDFVKTTEQDSDHRHLEKMSLASLLKNMNQEDKIVPTAVEQSLPQIELLVQAVVEKMKSGGRLFYIGAGTSGRLGVLDASEVPPTFGVSSNLVIGIIAGGKRALTDAIENAEDNMTQGWKDLLAHQISAKDIVVGIASSGTTPYVIEALRKCQETKIITGCIACNRNAPISKVADFPVEIIVGAEFLTGSTRLKSGTAQKLVLNMISTVAMIQLGRVKDNKMVNMQLTNEKLIDRGATMLMKSLGLESYAQAKALLLTYGSVAAAIANSKDKETGSDTR